MAKLNPIEMIKVYSEYSTISGLVYIFMKDQPATGRIFWSIAVIFLICIGLYWSTMSYNDWETRPVLTTISSTGFPISKIPFPSVTFCSQGKVPRILFASMIRQYFEFMKTNVKKEFGKNLTFFEIAAFLESKLANSAIPNDDSSVALRLEESLAKNWPMFTQASFPGITEELTPEINTFIQYIGAQLSATPDSIFQQVAIYTLRGKNFSTSPLEWMLNPDLLVLVNDEANASARMAKKFYETIDKKKSFRAFFQTMWYSLLPCYDIQGLTSLNESESSMLSYCSWRNTPVSCASIFSTFPTDSGMCCVFNMAKAENLFIESEYTNLVREMQSRDEKLAFLNTTKPEWSTRNVMGVEGKHLGLITILDGHTNLIGPMTVYDNLLGFTALVESQDNFPFIKTKGIPIMPGHINQIILSAVEIDASEEIRCLSPKSRNCLFQEETTDLRLHKVYTQNNCILECRITNAQKVVKEQFNLSEVCTPWYLPFINGTFCDPWQGKVFEATMSSGDESIDCLEKCLPDCRRTVYHPRVMTQKLIGCDERNLGLTGFCNLISASVLPKPHIFGQPVLDEFHIYLNKNPPYLNSIQSNLRTKSNFLIGKTFHLVNRTYDAFETDIAVAAVYFDTPTAIKFLTEPRLNWVDFISNVGGLLGLCLGLSIVTIIEILWLILRIGNALFRQNQVCNRHIIRSK